MLGSHQNIFTEGQERLGVIIRTKDSLHHTKGTKKLNQLRN